MKYPFSPEVLDALPERIAELYRELEIELLEGICKRLDVSGQLNEVTVQNIRALRSHGITLNEIKRAISRKGRIAERELDKLLDDVVRRNEQYYGEQIDIAKVTQPEHLVNESDIDRIREQTKGEFANITQSMAFLIRQGGKVVQLPPAKAYQWALDKAALQIESGAVNYNDAIRGAIKQLADSGLKTVEYESGHADHIDVAARRAIMTGVAQISDKYTVQSAELLGTNRFEVSAHRGARDTGYGPMNHKSWQGKVYSTAESDIYPNIYEVCGLGTGEGLEGWNCRHRRFPWIEGVSERTYTDEQLKNIDPPPFEYEGRTYTAYEATQKQRMIERTIRSLERRRAAQKAAGLGEDATATGAKLRRLKAKYKEFSKAAQLPEQPERTRVYSSHEKEPTLAFSVSYSNNGAKNSPNGFDIKGAASGYREFLKSVPPKNRTLLEYVYDATPIEKTDDPNVVMAYSAKQEKILYNPNHADFEGIYSNETLTHELGHRLDHMFNITSDSDAWSSLLELCRKEISKNRGLFVDYSWSSDYNGFISDIFSAIDKSDIYAAGHRLQYWEAPGHREEEIFANLFSLECANSTQHVEFLRQHFPELITWYESVVYEVE